MIVHNSFNEIYRKPLGAIVENTKVEFFLKTDENYDTVSFRIWTQEDMEKRYDMKYTGTGFKTELEFENPGTYWYYFILNKEGKTYYYYCKDGYTGGEGWSGEEPRGSFQVTVYSKALRTPEWFTKSIMYQIFPDRFNRKEPIGSYTGARNIHFNWNEKPNFLDTGSSNYDFFGGNLRGVAEKLDYLQQLGINVIYFNPIFQSSSNHRYDTGDYMKIDSMLGNERDLSELISKGKKLGIEIVLDGVFNHTGSDSKYFNKYGHYEGIGAYQSKDSEYYSWYKFDSFPNSYESWWGIDTLPNVNENDKSFKDFIYGAQNSVIKKWMELGIKGWRLDVADELPNDFLEGFYARTKEFDNEAIVIGEVWEDASNKRSYGSMRKYVQGKQFDSIMNYPLRKLIIDFLAYGYFEEGADHREIDAYELSQKLLNLYNNYPRSIFYSLMNFLSTHDTNRIMTIFSEAPNERTMSKKNQCNYVPTMQQIEIATKRLKIAWAFIISMPGVPCIYYGDEIGMFGYRDPFNRGTYPWNNVNKELVNFFSKMNRYRKEIIPLTMGDLEVVYAKEDVIGIQRKYKNEVIVFLMNRNKIKSTSIVIDSRYRYMDIESGGVISPNDKNKMTIDINSLSYKLLRKII